MSPHSPHIVAPRKLTGRIAHVLTGKNKGRLGFATSGVPHIDVDLEGILDNRYRGWTRRADSRTPYLPRGATIRNDRQLSLVSIEDLAAIAGTLGIDTLNPAWIGASVVVAGIPQFSFLPRGTHLFTSGGAILTVTDQNAPCTLAGEAVANAIGRPEVKQLFPKVAMGLRGLVAAVEHPGRIEADTTLVARLPAQWVYGRD